MANGPRPEARGDHDEGMTKGADHVGGGEEQRERGKAGEATEETMGEELLCQVVGEDPQCDEETAEGVDDNEGGGGVEKHVC